MHECVMSKRLYECMCIKYMCMIVWMFINIGNHAYVYGHVYDLMNVCIHKCLYACVWLNECVCMDLHMVCLHGLVACFCVFAYKYMKSCTCVWFHECVCMHKCLYVCVWLNECVSWTFMCYVWMCWQHAFMCLCGCSCGTKSEGG